MTDTAPALDANDPRAHPGLALLLDKPEALGLSPLYRKRISSLAGACPIAAERRSSRTTPAPLGPLSDTAQANKRPLRFKQLVVCSAKSGKTKRIRNELLAQRLAHLGKVAANKIF